MRLRVGFTKNPRVQPLVDGEVAIEGVELEWTQSFRSPGELFLTQLKENAFDLFEFSIADYLVTKSRPDWARLGWIALPMFVTKPLGLLLNLHANVQSGVRSYADLKGKRFGLPDFGMTAAVWLRIMLRKLYGIQPQDITWYNGRPPSHRHGRILDIDSKPLNGVRLINLDEGASLDDLLQRGEIDAAFGSPFGAAVDATADVKLVSTPAMLSDMIGELHRREVLTPVNHVLVLKEKHLEADPGLAQRLYQAFETSKHRAYARAQKLAAGYLLFPSEAFAAQASLLGEDPFPAGLAANRRMLAATAEQLTLDGIIPSSPELEPLFAEGVRGT